MANKNSTLKQAKVEKETTALDAVAKKLLSTLDSSYKDRTVLNTQDARIQQIIADELNFSRGVSNGSVIDFISAMTNKSQKGRGDPPEVDTSALFTKDIGDIYGYFQDMYKNRFIEITDLKFISKFIPAIGEAVKTTLDSIVSADDVSSSITRNLVFSADITKSEQEKITAEIRRIENDEKLLKRLKNIVFRKALVTGQHYVYHIPYSELFAEYEKRTKTGQINSDSITHAGNIDTSILRNKQTKSGFNLRSANECSVSLEQEQTPSLESAIESTIEGAPYLDKDEKNVVKKMIGNASLCSITLEDEIFMADAMEGIQELTNLNTMPISHVSATYANMYGGVGEIDDVDTEGTTSTGGSSRIGKYKVSGTYIKYIEAKNLIPIRVYNQVIGYFHIHSQSSARKKNNKSTANTTRETNITSIGASIFSSANLTEKKKDQVITDIVDTIADGILSNFSPKFVTKYAEHKKLISDCLIANGIINNDYQIQFIPVDYITPFVINEDENGNGESILLDALFPAKLLLSLVVSKLLTYMNKGGNKTIAYVGKGPIDVNGANHTQRVIRMLQESNVTFNDLLSTNLVFSKFSRDSNIQIPKARNGDKLVEFETQEGQQIDLKPEMEDWLEKMAIMGTGVPSVIMEYTDAADYAKSIVSANIKFAGRVASLQSDLEDASTDLYRALLRGSSLDDRLKGKAINGVTFKLPRPKVLSNANNADYIRTIYESAQTIVEMKLGNDEVNQNNPDFPKIRTEAIKNIVIANTPFFDWEETEDLIEQAITTIVSTKDFDKSNADDSGSGDIGNLGGSDEF